AMLQQERGEILSGFVTAVDDQRQGGPPIFIQRIDVGRGLDKQICLFRQFPVIGSSNEPMQSGASVVVPRVWICAVRQQQLYYFLLSCGGVHQRRLIVVSTNIGVRAAIQ